MKKLLLVIMVVLITAGLCWADGYEVRGKAGSYTVIATFDKERPVKGTNRMEIAITDAASRPVTDAQLHIEYFMPSFPGRPPMMDYRLFAKPSGRRYRAALNLSMRGEWRVAVSIIRPNETEKMTFGFEVK